MTTFGSTQIDSQPFSTPDLRRWFERTCGRHDCFERRPTALGLLASALIAVIPLVFASCGGTNQPTTAGTAPSNLSYPQSSINATVGAAITADTPTITGTVTSYSSTPALPAGLVLDTSMGTISGTPTATSAAATYVVKAANSFGSTTTSVQITVKLGVLPPAQFAYPQTSLVLEVGQPFASDIPAYSGTVGSFSVSPALPAGLTLDPATGAVYGVPSAASASNQYTVTASNQGGSTTASLTLAVNPALTTLLDLGSAHSIAKILSVNGKVAVEDVSGHWVLIDYASGTTIASGEQGLNGSSPPLPGLNSAGPWPFDMEGSTLAVGVANGLELRSTVNGQLLAILSSPLIDHPVREWWRLAADGSYVCAGSSAGLSAWSNSGALLFNRTGDYSGANVFAAPGKIQVASGAAGSSVIETVSVADGSSVVGPGFSGSFNMWFADGSHFLTSLGNNVWTYDTSSVQQSFVTLPTSGVLGAVGNWLWTFDSTSTYTLTVYAAGSATAAGTYTVGVSGTPIPSGQTVALVPPGWPSLTVIDLSGATPAENTYAVPTANNAAYAWTSASMWFFGNGAGAVIDGASLSATPRYLTQGSAVAIGGSASEVAVTVSNGTIYSFDPTIATPQQTISFLSSQVALSADGSVLVAEGANDVQYQPDQTLNVYALPAATLIHSFPYQLASPGGPNLMGFSFATGGSNIGVGTATYTASANLLARQVTAVTGGPVLWSDTPPPPSLPALDYPAPPQLSPDGSLIAAVSDVRTPGVTTTIFNNGTAATAVSGFAVGWIDDTQLLVDNYSIVKDAPPYNGCTIYSSSGVAISSPPLPEIQHFQPVSPGLIYTPDSNTIYSTSSGQATWTSPYPYGGVGATAGGYVVFLSGARVVAQSQ